MAYAGEDPIAEHKAHQRRYHDHEVKNPEFEMTRPRGAGRFYTFLMNFKVRTAVGLLRRELTGRGILVVCAGSGMDAELLLPFGPRIVCLDISAGALQRAARRAQRHGLSYGLVNGDVEHLPFPNDAFDYAFVHDGLHHLTNRDAGVAEMVRVSRCGVMITEPADALLTKLAIALRLIPAREESGNLVLRFDAASLGHRLDDLGFPEFASTRYLMKYGHPPARWWRLFDHPLLFSVARLGFLIIGVRMLGKFGNKLAVAAVRHSSSLVPSTSLLSTPEGSTVHARPKGGKRVPMSWDGRPGLVAVEH